MMNPFHRLIRRLTVENETGVDRAALRLQEHREAQAKRLKDADLSDTPTRQSRRRKARGKPF